MFCMLMTLLPVTENSSIVYATGNSAGATPEPVTKGQVTVNLSAQSNAKYLSTVTVGGGQNFIATPKSEKQQLRQICLQH